MSRKYSYRVVSSNGAASYGARDYRGLPTAKAMARKVREADYTPEPIEIERVEHLANGASRYWMRKGNRWVLWDPAEDAELRQPDFCLPRIRGGS